MSEITIRHRSIEQSPAPTDRKSVEDWLKRFLRDSVYEDSDFRITDNYISIDLLYDSKDYVLFYQTQIMARYPRNTKIRGTKVTIHFGDGL